jgi:hypothetical protein
MTYPTDPHYQPQREMDAGMTAATWMSVAFIVLLFAGVGIWAYYKDDAATTASVKQPFVEQSVPPATTGQGAPRDRAQ